MFPNICTGGQAGLAEGHNVTGGCEMGILWPARGWQLAPAKSGRGEAKAELVLRIEKWLHTAQILLAIFFQQRANLSGAIGRSVRGGEPLPELGNDGIGRDAGDFQTGSGKKAEQAAQRIGFDVRRVAKFFDAILIRGTLGMLAGDDVFHENGAAGAADADHFAQDALGIFEVMDGEAADDDGEISIGKRELMHVAGTIGKVLDGAFVAASFGNSEERVGEIDADNLAADARKRFGDEAGPGGDVKDAVIHCGLRHSNEFCGALGISDPGRSGEGAGLLGEGFANDVFVLWHGGSLAVIHRQENECVGSKEREY